MRRAPLAITLCLALASCACSARRMAAGYAGGMIGAGMSAYYEETDLQTARDSLLANLKLVEVLHKNDPSDLALRVSLSQGYCSYAFMFLEDADPERAKTLYRKGAGFTDAYAGETPEKGGKYFPALFWNSFCKASYVQLDLQNPDSIALLPKLSETADALVNADPDFYYSGPRALKGALCAARPVLMGGNPAQAKTQFDAALSGPGAKFQLNRFLYAKTYAVQTQDPELFEKLLSEAADGAQDLPEQALANTAVKARAKLLMEKKDDLF